MSVRAADCENCIGDLVIAPAAKVPGKGAAVDIVATLIQRDQHGFWRDRRRNGRGFLRDAGVGVARPALGQLANLEAAESELAADIVEALAIALGKFPFRPLLEPSDSDDEEAHDQPSCRV